MTHFHHRRAVPKCIHCGGYTINTHLHGRVPDKYPLLCNVCYWREEAESLQAKVAEVVAELRGRQGEAYATAADLVEAKLLSTAPNHEKVK